MKTINSKLTIELTPAECRLIEHALCMEMGRISDKLKGLNEKDIEFESYKIEYGKVSELNSAFFDLNY